MRNLIVYESKYGTTKESAYILSKIIGYSKIIKPQDFNEKDKKFDNYIFLSPIYSEHICTNILNLIKDNKDWLINKDIYFIIVNLSDRSEFYLKEIKDILKTSFILGASINGNLILDKLDKSDYEAIKKFFSITNMPMEDNIKFNINEVIDVALNIKMQIDSRKPKLQDYIIKDIVIKFISNHNTCVLSTSYDKYPRATPIEYIFYENYLYFITEGGVKYSNILRNNNVSIGIFDNYNGMNKIGGLQISGKAILIDYKSEEYYEIMKIRNISSNAIDNLDIVLNMFKVEIEKVEALNSDFKKYNGDTKQIINKF